MCALCDVRMVPIDEETSGCVPSLVCFPVWDERLPLESCELQLQTLQSTTRASRRGIRSCRLLSMSRRSRLIQLAISRFDPSRVTRCRWRLSSPSRSWRDLWSVLSVSCWSRFVKSSKHGSRAFWDLMILQGILGWTVSSWEVNSLYHYVSFVLKSSCDGTFLLHDEINVNLRCRLRDAVMYEELVIFRRCHLHSDKHKIRSPLESHHTCFQVSLSGIWVLSLLSSNLMIFSFEKAILSKRKDCIFCRIHVLSVSKSKRVYMILTKTRRLSWWIVLYFSVL